MYAVDKLRLKFKKTGRAVYISHLDLMRTLQRAFFRAKLPLRYSEGFNPHARISILLPLQVGVGSVCEYMDFWLTAEVDLASIPVRLNEGMPEGIEVLEVYPAEHKGAELKWLELEGVFRGGRGAAFYEAFFARDDITVTRRTKRGEKTENIAPYIRQASFQSEGDALRCRFVISAQEPTISPELLVQALGEDRPDYHRFERKAVFFENMQEFR